MKNNNQSIAGINKFSFLVATVCFVGTNSAQLFAQDYQVEPVKSVGVNPVVTDSARELLISGLRKAGVTVSELAGPDTYIVKSKLVSLGSSVILQAEKATTQKTIFAVELKAASVEELDKVCDRVA